MLTLSAKIRETKGKKNKTVRKQGRVPAVLYGPKIKEAFSIEVDLKEFEKIFRDAGESSLVSLKVEGGKSSLKGETPVLIHDLERDSLTGNPIHIDFYQPPLEKEITVHVPLIFEGIAPAVKDLGATLVRNIQAVEVRALPQNLPHEIKVDIGALKLIEDVILVGSLKIPPGAEILKNPQETVASVSLPEKIEEEAKPVAEKAEATETAEAPKEAGAAEAPSAKEEKKETGKQK